MRIDENKDIYIDKNVLRKVYVSYPDEIATTLINLLDNSYDRECYDREAIIDCLYQIKCAAENEYNFDYWRQFYNLMMDIERASVIPF